MRYNLGVVIANMNVDRREREREREGIREPVYCMCVGIYKAYVCTCVQFKGVELYLVSARCID